MICDALPPGMLIIHAVLLPLRLGLLCMRVARFSWCAGIFDGHRGWKAAQYAAEHFQEHLLSQTQGSDAGSALRAAFLSLDASFARSQVLCHLGSFRHRFKPACWKASYACSSHVTFSASHFQRHPAWSHEQVC